MDVLGRVSELMVVDELPSGCAWVYKRDGNYETFQFVNAAGHVFYDYRETYHPNTVCEGSGVCRWCGCTLW